MYCGLIGAVGGIVGKGTLTYFVTKLFMKEPKPQKEKIKISNKMLLLIGFGIGLIIYNFLSGNASLENALIGITTGIMFYRNTKNPTGFWYGFLPTFSKKVTKETIKSTFVGITLGLVFGVVLSCIIVEGSFIPYMVGAITIVIAVLLRIIKSRKLTAAATMFLLSLVVCVSPVFAESLPSTGDFNGLKITYTISGVSITNSEDDNDFTKARTLEGTCSKGTVSISGTFLNDWGADAGVSVTITTSSGSEKFSDTLSKKKKSTSFSISLPVTKNDKSVSISIANDASYGNGQFRGLEIGGTFENTSYVEPVKKQEKKDEDTKSYWEDRLENGSNKNCGCEEDYEDTHADVSDTIAISVASMIFSIIGLLFTSIFGGGYIPPTGSGDDIGAFDVDTSGDGTVNITNDDDYIKIVDPASGAETGYKKDKNTGEWISLDGSTILDQYKVEKWKQERQADRAWMNEQNEKIKNGDTELGRDLKEISDKEKEDLKKIKEQSKKEIKQFRDELYDIIKRGKEQNEKMAAMWTKQGNIFKTAEVTAEVTSVICDSAIDIYGHVNPGFARGYKIIKGGLGSAAADGWTLAGFTEGTIKGTADALLVGSKLSLKDKAYVRFASRSAAAMVGSKMRGENDEQYYNSLKNGVVDGMLHAGTGFAMDKLTGKLPKFEIKFIDPVKNTTTASKLTTATVKEIFGTQHGGAQRAFTRGVRDFIVKPYLTNPIKKKKI